MVVERKVFFTFKKDSYWISRVHLGHFLDPAVVQSLSHVWLFATPWTAACQTSLSFTISQSLLKLMFVESVMPSNHLILCRPLSCSQSFPPSGSFPTSQFFASGGWSIGASASASVLSMKIQSQYPLGLTGLVSLLYSKVLFLHPSSSYMVIFTLEIHWAIYLWSVGFSKYII